MKPIIDYLNVQLEGLGLFTSIHGMGQVDSRMDGETEIGFVNVYSGSGESISLEFDNTSAMVVHIPLGEISRSELESHVGCDTRIQESRQMRLFATFNRNEYCQDDAYQVEKVVKNIMNTISFSSVRELRRTLKADRVSIMATTGNSDSRAVWEQIFTGVDYTLPGEIALVSVDYEVVIEGSLSCFPILGCNDEEIDVTQNIIDRICPGVSIYESDGVTLRTIIPAGGSYTLTETPVSNMEIINYTAPLGFDATYISRKKVKFTALAGKSLDDMVIFLDGNKQKHKDATPANNELRQILPDGTIEWWQNSVNPTNELIVVYKTS